MRELGRYGARQRSQPLILAAMLFVTLNHWPAAATAGSPGAQMSAEEKARSREFYKLGKQLYEQEKYAQALVQFQAALKLVRRHSLEFNIAQCHRKLGHDRKALQHYRSYLEGWRKENPQRPAPSQELVQGHIDRLARQIEAEDAATRPDAVPAAALKPVHKPRPAAAKGSPPIYKQWWFWTAIGVVAVGSAAAGMAVALQPEDVPPVQGTLSPGQFKLP